MGLIIQLLHSMGQEDLELEAPPPDAPLILGRSEQASIVVPSTMVSRRHCALFAQEGRWFLRDLGSTAGTFLNGRKVTQPVPLQPGDVISLGNQPHPPTIVIRPADSAPAPTGLWRDEDIPLGAIPPNPPPPSSSPPAEAAAETETGGVVEAAAPWPAVPPQRYYLPAPKALSNTAIAAAVLGSLLILGLATGFIYRLPRSAAPVPPPPDRQTSSQPPLPTRQSLLPATQPTPVAMGIADPTSAPKPSGIFTDPDPAPSSRSVPTTAPAPAVPRPPRPQPDPEWEMVLEMHRLSDPVSAIVKYDDYRRQHPTNSHQAELDKLTELDLDRLWFDRLNQLCAARQALSLELARLNQQIAQQPDASRKKALADQRAPLLEKDQELDGQLKEMSYTATTGFDRSNIQQIEQLRAARSPTAYATWKQRVLSSIRRTRGGLPWADAK